MNTLERLAHWRMIGAAVLRADGKERDAAFLESRTFKDEYDLFAFFDCFRPEGKGVERVFDDVVGGDEILERLLKVYACTKESYNRYMYFIVSRPQPATPAKLVELTTAHLDKMRQIAIGFGEVGLACMLGSHPQIRVTHEPMPDRRIPDLNEPEINLYDVAGDWFRELEALQSDALLMHEAFYSLACDYNIARYLMWPLYRHATAIDEPFAPYFELWTLGARAIFETPELVSVYVAGES